MWSIGLEWQLYLLFPTDWSDFSPCRCRRNPRSATTDSVAIRGTYAAAMPLSAVLRDGPLSYLINICSWDAGGGTRYTGANSLAEVGTWNVVVTGLTVVTAGTGNGLVHDLATAVAFFGCVGSLLRSKRTVARVLSSQWPLRHRGCSRTASISSTPPLLHLSWFALSRSAWR